MIIIQVLDSNNVKSLNRNWKGLDKNLKIFFFIFHVMFRILEGKGGRGSQSQGKIREPQEEMCYLSF